MMYNTNLSEIRDNSLKKVHKSKCFGFGALSSTTLAEKTYPTKLQALVLVKVIATVVTSCWLSWKNNPSNYGWNEHMFENGIEKLPQMYILSGQACPSHRCHTKCLKNCHGSSKIDGLLGYIYTVSKCQVPCYESYSSPKKEATDHLLLNSHRLRGISVTMGELGGV